MGYCSVHAALHNAFAARRVEIKNNQWSYLYNSARWHKERAEWLERNPECVVCGEVAIIVDHIIAHRGDVDLFWDKDNWQSLCKRCHSRKTLYEERRRQVAEGEGRPYTMSK
jgi:5-methylcytosine-specific restriction protein A